MKANSFSAIRKHRIQESSYKSPFACFLFLFVERDIQWFFLHIFLKKRQTKLEIAGFKKIRTILN